MPEPSSFDYHDSPFFPGRVVSFGDRIRAAQAEDAAAESRRRPDSQSIPIAVPTPAFYVIHDQFEAPPEVQRMVAEALKKAARR